MPSSNNNNTEFVKALSETAFLAQTLLSEIQSNATSLAKLETKLETLSESVKSLSTIIRDGNGNGSLITRVAIIERDIKELREDIDKEAQNELIFKEEVHARINRVKELFINDGKDEKTYRREKAVNKIKLAGVAIPGLIALVLKILELFEAI